MGKCKECGKEKTIIHLAGGQSMCIECYWNYLKKNYPDQYRDIVSARRA